MYIRNFQMCDWSIKENIRVNEPSYQNEKFLLFDNGIIKVRRIFYHMKIACMFFRVYSHKFYSPS